eukprot:gene13812-biopygen14128
MQQKCQQFDCQQFEMHFALSGAAAGVSQGWVVVACASPHRAGRAGGARCVPSAGTAGIPVRSGCPPPSHPIKQPSRARGGHATRAARAPGAVRGGARDDYPPL